MFDMFARRQYPPVRFGRIQAERARNVFMSLICCRHEHVSDVVRTHEIGRLRGGMVVRNAEVARGREESMRPLGGSNTIFCFLFCLLSVVLAKKEIEDTSSRSSMRYLKGARRRVSLLWSMSWSSLTNVDARVDTSSNFLFLREGA
jgi:hypothetical protein